MSKHYELEMDGINDIESSYEVFNELKNEIEKELRYFEESDEDEMKIKILKEGVS